MKVLNVVPKVGDWCILTNDDGYHLDYGQCAVGEEVKVLSNPLPCEGSLSVQAVEHEGLCYCFRSEMLKPIELKEDKPVNKVNMVDEHVECAFNRAWEAVKEFEESYLYIKTVKDGYQTIKDIPSVMHCMANCTIYRKVSRPITWQEAVRDFMGKQSVTGKYFSTIEMLDDEFVLTEGEFIEMCHLVTSLTRKEK